MTKKYNWEVWWKDIGERVSPDTAKYKYPHTALKAAKHYLREKKGWEVWMTKKHKGEVEDIRPSTEQSGSSENISVSIYDQDNKLIKRWDDTLINLIKPGSFAY